jgi:glycosyltransferase involved in cell wall biosynthesis
VRRNRERLSAAGIPNFNIRGRGSENRPVQEKLCNLLSYYWRLLLFIFRNRGGTIHFTGVFRNELIIIEGVIFSLAFRMAARRYVYTAHNILPHNRGRSLFFRWVYRLIYRFPHFVVVHTPETRRVLIDQFGVSEAKILVMSIGLNEEVAATALGRTGSRARLGYEDKAKVVLFFGRIDEYKGLDLLIAAFDLLEMPDTHLMIAGAFRSSGYRERILAGIAGARRRADIRLDARLVPNEEVGVLFDASDVLCLPYRNIYQSGLLFLAMRFGKPVVATNVGSLAEFVTPDIGLVTKTNDAQGIANAIQDLFAAPEKFPKERILAQAEKYRWDHVCRVLLPLYEAGVGNGQIPASHIPAAPVCF